MQGNPLVDMKYNCMQISVSAKLTVDKLIWTGESAGSSLEPDYMKNVMRIWMPQSDLTEDLTDHLSED